MPEGGPGWAALGRGVLWGVRGGGTHEGSQALVDLLPGQDGLVPRLVGHLAAWLRCGSRPCTRIAFLLAEFLLPGPRGHGGRGTPGLVLFSVTCVPWRQAMAPPPPSWSNLAPARCTDEETEALQGPGTCLCSQTVPARPQPCPLLGAEDRAPEQRTARLTLGQPWERGTPLRPGCGLQSPWIQKGCRVTAAGPVSQQLLRRGRPGGVRVGTSGWPGCTGFGAAGQGPPWMPSGYGSDDPGEGHFGQSWGLGLCPWVTWGQGSGVRGVSKAFPAPLGVGAGGWAGPR